MYGNEICKPVASDEDVGANDKPEKAADGQSKEPTATYGKIGDDEPPEKESAEASKGEDEVWQRDRVIATSSGPVGG